MINPKKLLSILLLLPMLLTIIPQAMAPDNLVYFQDFEVSNGSWTMMNGTWNFLDNRLNGIRTNGEWDDIVLADTVFNMSEYTVVFDVNLQSGYGEEQFHFIFNYYSGYTVMELGSTSGYSHYIDSYGGWYDFDYQFPTDKWAIVHMAVASGQLDLWINGEQILSSMTMNIPNLEDIGFGLYSNSSAQFDNIQVYTGYHTPPDQPTDETIYYDDFASYNLDPYSWYGGPEGNWEIENEWLRGYYYSNISSESGWLTTTTIETHEDLYSYTIEVDYDIHLANGDIMLLGWRFNSGEDVQFIRYSYQRNVLEFGSEDAVGEQFTYHSMSMESQLTWGRLIVAVAVESDKQMTQIFLQEEELEPYKILTHDDFNVIKCGNIGFGFDSQEINTETLVYWDNIWIRQGFYPPKIDEMPDDSFSSEDFSVSSGDAFIYRLTEYSGASSEVDLTGWFRKTDVEENIPLFLAQEDQLKLKVVDFVEWGIEVEVHKNTDEYIGNGINNFFFLPIHGNLTNFKMFENTFLVEESDFYRLSWNYTEAGNSDDGVLEFLWNKQTGVLEELELVSGSISPEGSEISIFKFELIESITEENTDDTTIPSLSPGWEFISILGVIISIPIVSRRKRA
ncbi:MAG: hypothetical protein ACW99R_09070 [Candidatus Hodarchaeales archaeon]|jgi:hypothetical protein